MPLKEELFILFFAICALVTDVLDQAVFSSNLELYAVYNIFKTFIVLGLCNKVISSMNWFFLPILLIGSYTVFIFLSDLSLFGTPETEQIYSNYGFLNVGEYHNLRIISCFAILPFLFYSTYSETINSSSVRTSARTYLALFGFIVLYSVPFLWYLLGRVLIGTNSFKPMIEFVIPTSFILSYSLLTISALWRK
jgi:hypothetical protein